MLSRCILRRCRLPDGGEADVLIEDGRITRVERCGVMVATPDEIDARGCLVTPGLANLHLHPDKAFGLDGAGSSATSIADAIAQVRAQKPSVTAELVRERTLRLLGWCLALGTTYVRVHAEVDPLLQLRSVEGVLAAREALRGRMRIEVVAFPQEGIVREPGTLELMEEALRMGCDVVGAISYVDPDPGEHLALAAGLARRFGVPLDVHADLGVPPQATALGVLATATHAYGLEGRVSAGHCTTLATMDAGTRGCLTERLRKAGITVIALPRTDLFLDGTIAPLEGLRANGLRCLVATNNVRNAFTPVGRPSLPSVAAVYALARRVASRSDLDLLARSLWQGSAESGPDGLQPGATADLCLWPVEEAWRLVADEPEPALVMVGGAVVAGQAPLPVPAG